MLSKQVSFQWKHLNRAQRGELSQGSNVGSNLEDVHLLVSDLSPFSFRNFQNEPIQSFPSNFGMPNQAKLTERIRRVGDFATF